jgi:hypothetical protein
MPQPFHAVCPSMRKRPCSDFDSVAKLKKFIFHQANFAGECGRFGEKFNVVKNKIGQL